MQFERRREQLRKRFSREKLDGLLVTNLYNVTYLTGFTGDSSYLLLTPEREVLISDARYTTQIQEECPGLDAVIRRPGVKMDESVAQTAKAMGARQLGIEAGSMSVALYEALKAAHDCGELVPTAEWVEHLRERKDPREIAEIRKAIALAERAFEVIRASLRPEQTEKEVADALEHQIRLFGGRGCSFPSIVAVGDRAALAHYRPGNLRLEESPLLLIDWGAVGQGYVSDLTRVLVMGKPTKKLERIYETVLRAQQAGIAAIRPGAVMQDVDTAARRVIEEAGYGKRFGHSLGHGIGMEVHEQPRLAVGQQRPLKAGMVVTVEPGIYVPGWGGVRIEDDVLVTPSGHEVLSSVPKELAACRCEYV